MAQKKKKKKRIRVAKPKRFLLWLLVLMLITAGILLFNSTLFDVQEITVYGASRFNADSIIAVSGITKGVNILKVDELAVKERLEQEPFIEVQDIKRCFPAKVEIYIKEREIFMQMPCTDGYLFLDREGHALVKREEQDAGVPLVEGLTLEEEQLGKCIVATVPEKFQLLQELLEQTDHYGISPLLEKIDLTQSGDLTLELKDDITIKLGYGVDLDEKLSLYESAYAQLKEKWPNGGTMDFSIPETPIFCPNAADEPSDTQTDTP